MNQFSRLLSSNALAGKFTRYILIGGSAAVVDLGAFLLLIDFDLHTGIAAATSFAIAAVYNFTLSSVFVFRLRSTWRRFRMFVAFAVAGLLINTIVTIVANIWLTQVLAKIAGIAVAFGVNFWMNNSIVFGRDRRSPSAGVDSAG